MVLGLGVKLEIFFPRGGFLDINNFWIILHRKILLWDRDIAQPPYNVVPKNYVPGKIKTPCFGGTVLVA